MTLLPRLAVVTFALLSSVGCVGPFMALVPQGPTRAWTYNVTLTVDPAVIDAVRASDGVIGYAARKPDGGSWWDLRSADDFQLQGYDDPDGFLDQYGCHHKGSFARDFIAYAGPDVSPDLGPCVTGDDGYVTCDDSAFDAFDPFTSFVMAPISVTPVVTVVAACADDTDELEVAQVAMELIAPE